MIKQAYAHGIVSQLLLGETIGANLGRTMAAHPDREAIVTLPRGEPGAFQTRGCSVMLGYWEDPERTAEAQVPAGMQTA
jgi:long-subunit acyl-CoA synthetase (AMP-forming)